ncbi:cytochrome c oxidase assembly protein [Bacillus sp. V3-13]|uniref:SCO family protein n=1 Tax=Bacillus sp. V3-13 TaxID=2053728 RepID=UPI000C763911|nr:SCO family protein [Bacillus sp. V3-13]PLR77282.1 cytochrome c oxidase assembly protein [Bacillus sp. V3-13]
MGFMLIAAAVLSACGQKEIENAKDWPVSDFTYTNQEGEAFGLKDLKGKVWVADFIFTSCDDVCIPMTHNMAKLQKMAKDEGIENIEFVSFTVDPEVDDGATLKNYAEHFNADFANWNFLTGYTQDEIQTFAVDVFKTLVQKPENDDQVIHGTEFHLVDQEGTIVQSYSGLNDIPFEQMISDIKTLQ